MKETIRRKPVPTNEDDRKQASRVLMHVLAAVATDESISYARRAQVTEALDVLANLIADANSVIEALPYGHRAKRRASE